jgi:dihydroneopterin aldolase
LTSTLRPCALTLVACGSARGRSVRGVVQGPPRQLVEAVAQDVAATLLREFPAAAAVAVRVCKPHVAMPGALHSLGAFARPERASSSCMTRC